MSKQMGYTLFTEKYRPKTIKGLILPNRLKKYFSKIVTQNAVPNMLLVSNSPGTGKTSTAKAIANEIGADYIYINTSSEGGIDTLRDTIQKYAAAYSIEGDPDKKKIVILDESDGATPALQLGLRAAMEEFHDTCRFILTCNFATKLIPALKSRCEVIDFNMTNKDEVKEMRPKICQRLATVLKKEDIEYKESTIVKLVDTYYPDIRKMMCVLQHFSQTNDVIDDKIFNQTTISTELIDKIKGKKFGEAREFIIQSSYSFDELYTFLYKHLVPVIDKGKQGQVILTIAEYMHQSAFSIDKEITFAACMLEIMAVL